MASPLSDVPEPGGLRVALPIDASVDGQGPTRGSGRGERRRLQQHVRSGSATCELKPRSDTAGESTEHPLSGRARRGGGWDNSTPYLCYRSKKGERRLREAPGFPGKRAGHPANARERRSLLFIRSKRREEQRKNWGKKACESQGRSTLSFFALVKKTFFRPRATATSSL